MRYDLRLEPETRLERAVARWLRSEARDRDGSVSDVLRDLFYGGCASGVVGDLVYTKDAARFYVRHSADIDRIVSYLVSELDWSPNGIDGWDPEDPFAKSDNNRNYLAWLGFEQAARTLADRAGYDG